MSIFEYDKDREEALLRKDEYEAGEKQGIAIGEKRMQALTKLLIQNNRLDDLRRITDDVPFYESLLLEFGLTDLSL